VSRRLVSRRHFAPPLPPRKKRQSFIARARARAPTSRRRRHRENDSRQITPAGCDKIRDTRIKMISRDRNSARYRLKPTHLDLDVITVASLPPPSLPPSLSLSLSRLCEFSETRQQVARSNDRVSKRSLTTIKDDTKSRVRDTRSNRHSIRSDLDCVNCAIRPEYVRLDRHRCDECARTHTGGREFYRNPPPPSPQLSPAAAWRCKCWPLISVINIRARLSSA